MQSDNKTPQEQFQINNGISQSQMDLMSATNAELYLTRHTKQPFDWMAIMSAIYASVAIIALASLVSMTICKALHIV